MSTHRSSSLESKRNSHYSLDHDNARSPSLYTMVMRMRRRICSRQFFLLVLLTVGGLSLYYLRSFPSTSRGLVPPNSIPDSIPRPPKKPYLQVPAPDTAKTEPYHIGSAHPIWQ